MAAKKKKLPEPLFDLTPDEALLRDCRKALLYMMEKSRWNQLSTRLYLAGDPECNMPEQILEDLRDRLGNGEDI